MKRKIIRQGNDTLTITLPKEWTRRFGVKAGDEVALEEKGNAFLVHTGKSLSVSRIDVDITGMDGSSIILLLRGLYRKGYDNVIFRTKDTHVKHFRAGVTRKVEDVITTEINRLMGFELFNQTKEMFEIRSISTEPIEDFDSILRRIFLQTLQYYDDLEKAARQGDVTAMQSLIEKPDMLTKFISYASRLLNKKGYPKQDYSAFLYHLIESIELINDAIKNAARFVTDHKISFSREGLDILRRLNAALRLYYETYYNFKLSAVSEYSKQRQEIISRINNRFARLSKGELSAIIQLWVILDLIRESLRLRASLI